MSLDGAHGLNHGSDELSDSSDDYAELSTKPFVEVGRDLERESLVILTRLWSEMTLTAHPRIKPTAPRPVPTLISVDDSTVVEIPVAVTTV